MPLIYMFKIKKDISGSKGMWEQCSSSLCSCMTLLTELYCLVSVRFHLYHFKNRNPAVQNFSCARLQIHLTKLQAGTELKTLFPGTNPLATALLLPAFCQAKNEEKLQPAALEAYPLPLKRDHEQKCAKIQQADIKKQQIIFCDQFVLHRRVEAGSNLNQTSWPGPTLYIIFGM